MYRPEGSHCRRHMGEPPGVFTNPEMYKAHVLHSNPISIDSIDPALRHEYVARPAADINPFFKGDKDVDNLKYLRKDFMGGGILLQPELCGRHDALEWRYAGSSWRRCKNAFRIFTPSCEVILTSNHNVDVRIDRHHGRLTHEDHPAYPKHFYDQIRYVDFHAQSNYRRVLFGWKVERQIWMGHFQHSAEQQAEKFCGWSILPKDIVLKIINKLYTDIPYHTVFTKSDRMPSTSLLPNTPVLFNSIYREDFPIWKVQDRQGSAHPFCGHKAYPFLRFSYKGDDIPTGSTIVACIRFGGLWLAPKCSFVKPIWTIEKVFYKHKTMSRKYPQLYLDNFLGFHGASDSDEES